MPVDNRQQYIPILQPVTDLSLKEVPENASVPNKKEQEKKHVKRYCVHSNLLLRPDAYISGLRQWEIMGPNETTFLRHSGDSEVYCSPKRNACQQNKGRSVKERFIRDHALRGNDRGVLNARLRT